MQREKERNGSRKERHIQETHGEEAKRKTEAVKRKRETVEK